MGKYALLAILIAAPAYAQTLTLTRDNDTFNIPEPSDNTAGDYHWSDGTYYTTIHRLKKPLDIGWWLKKMRLRPKKEAENVNALDDVPDSSWFTNRHAHKRMSSQALARGSATGSPPKGRWAVIKGKGTGINPGFTAKDEEGRLLFVKFDPPDFPGMGSNADVIVSRFLHAAGYNVPVYYQVWISSSDLRLSPKARIRGKYKVKRPMTSEDLKSILLNAPRNAQGKVLANVSIGLSGIPKGSFHFRGVRKDDPNDTVLHENRRELRGLRLFAAWFNNVDFNQYNTLDMYISRDGRKYLKHYLIDFSSSFGSEDTRPKDAHQGHEYFIDPMIISKSIGTLGLWVKPWENQASPSYPEIGYFEAKTFDPKAWRGAYPNPAFEKLTARDAAWAAKIITAFTDDDIRTIVQSGYFPTPGAQDSLVQTLIERRDKIGASFAGTI